MADKSKSSSANVKRKEQFQKSFNAGWRPGKATAAGKKPLPQAQPINVGHFFIMLVMKICRSLLFVDTSVKIGVYLIGVMMGSVICDLFAVPKTIFASSKNPLNQYFIKIGWGWTLLVVGSYISLTSYVYCSRNMQRVCQHLLRLVASTLIWYVCTKTFNYVESSVGVCTHPAHGNRSDCLFAGKNWLGFDISGHVFLEIHCLLIISEEIKTYKVWKRLGVLLDDPDLRAKRKVTELEIINAKNDYNELALYIKISVFFCAVLLVLFEFMLLTSTVYRFHTLPQKVVASFVAVFGWFLSYNVVYRFGRETKFLPVMPGDCPLDFMKPARLN